LTDFSKRTQISNFMDPSSGSRDVSYWRTDGGTDRYDQPSSRFSQFCERV